MRTCDAIAMSDRLASARHRSAHELHRDQGRSVSVRCLRWHQRRTT